MKVLILILSCDSKTDKYTIEHGISKTWNSITIKNAPTYHYFGGVNENFNDSSSIYTTCSEDYALMGLRTIEAFEYALNNFEFDYIFRTNISSYVNKLNLLTWLNDKPRTNFYSGVVGNHHGIRFASGSGFTLSKDLVKLLCESKHQLNYNLVDDVCFGQFLNTVTDITPAPRVDFPTVSSVTDFDKSNFHFRCKASNDRSEDSLIMNLIHNKFNLK
jgi:hypothetical protein